jgi:hypothetical protein
VVIKQLQNPLVEFHTQKNIVNGPLYLSFKKVPPGSSKNDLCSSCIPVNMKIPLLLCGPGEGEPRVPADHVVVDGQDGLGVHPHPRHLHTTINLQPSTINHQPSAINHQPSTINHQPSTTNHQPSTINHQPSTVNHQPSTINHQPSTINFQPSTIIHQPSTINHQPSTINHHQW